MTASLEDENAPFFKFTGALATEQLRHIVDDGCHYRATSVRNSRRIVRANVAMLQARHLSLASFNERSNIQNTAHAPHDRSMSLTAFELEKVGVCYDALVDVEQQSCMLDRSAPRWVPMVRSQEPSQAEGRASGTA